jgi:hypothetical protein
LIDTSVVWATRVCSTFVIIITIYRCIFARIGIIITIVITNFSSTFVMIITFNSIILTTGVWYTGNRGTSTFVWTFINFVFTST